MKSLKALISLTVIVSVTVIAQEPADTIPLHKLKEVVITATKRPQMLAKIPVQTILITNEEIKQTNAKNISEILATVAGMNIRSENIPGSSAYQSTYGGLDFDKGYVLVLINGERVLGGGMGEYGISVNQIPVEMIEKIEVVKGPASALYGSDAMGGVVNIITKPIPEKPLLRASVGAGSYDTYLGGISYGQQIGKFGFMANFNREDAKRGRYSASEDDFTGQYTLTKFQYKITPKVTINLGANYDDIKWEHATEKKTRISPSFEANFNDLSVFSINSYYYNLDFDLFSPGFTRRFGDIILMQVETQYIKPLGKKNILVAGTEYRSNNINMDVGYEEYFVDKRMDLFSFFLQDEISFRKFNFVLGGRIDKHSLYGIQYNPKISSMWNISDRTRLRLSAGKAFKSPTIRQLYVFFKHGNWWNRPDENLEPEKSWGYNIGLEKVFKNLQTNMNFFRNDINNIIAQVETDEKIDNVPVRIWENYQSAYAQGIELIVNASVFRGFSTSLSYTYLDTRNLDTDKRLPFTSEHVGNAGINYKIIPWKLSIHWSTRYYSECFSDARNTKTINPYSISNFKLIKGIIKNFEFSFEIDNIFDSDYGEPTKEWLGRTFLGRLSYKL